MIVQLISVILVAVLLVFPASPSRADSSRELVFGMSAAFTGANGEMGIEFYRGVMAYIDHFNANGGADGWTIRVIPANDGYNPAPCFRNTAKFIRDNGVFALFSYVGTPTTSHILPLLKKYEDRGVYLLFPLSGAQPLRTEPFGERVYNLRSSYFQETAGLVDNLVTIGRKRLAVFYQNDAYGRNGWDGVRQALKAYGLSIVSEATYKRGASFEQSYKDEIRLLMQGEPDAIICIGTYATQAGLVRDLRDQRYTLPVAGVSFANSDKMLDLLVNEGATSGRDYTKDLINTQVVPFYGDTTMRGVRLYRRLMENYSGMPSVPKVDYKPRRYSYVSFEGFLNGILLGEIVKRMADSPSPQRIPEVMESIRDFDIGIGERVRFGANDNQGLDRVHYTTVIEGNFRPILDWERWRR